MVEEPITTGNKDEEPTTIGKEDGDAIHYLKGLRFRLIMTAFVSIHTPRGLTHWTLTGCASVCFSPTSKSPL